MDESLATNLGHVWVDGDCVVTHHRRLGRTYLPLGTTAHKQGAVAGDNYRRVRAFRDEPKAPRPRRSSICCSTDRAAEHGAAKAGLVAVSTNSTVDDHKACYPRGQSITIRATATCSVGRVYQDNLFGR